MIWRSSILLGVLCIPLSVWAAPCLHYEGPAVSLTGRIVLRTFFGPPNYGEMPHEDTRETQAILVLPDPICVAANSASFEDAESAQTEITLVPAKDQKLSELAGKQVEIEGKLFHAITGHHHTAVLAEVEQTRVISENYVAASLLPTKMASRELHCGNNNSEVTLDGPEPLTRSLRTIASRQPDLLFDLGKFEKENFSYVGSVKVGKKSWHIVQLMTIWGQSCRGTRRLLIFDTQQRWIGQYSHFDSVPIRTDADSVVFDLGEGKLVNVNFSDSGPPATMFIEGDGPYDLGR